MIPIPKFAAEIFGFLEFGEYTSFFFEIVALVTNQAFTIKYIPSVAIPVNLSTNSVFIKDWSWSTSDTHTVLPQSTKAIGGRNKGFRISDAFIIDSSSISYISYITLLAFSIVFPLFTIIIDRMTSIVRSEVPADGALNTDSIFPLATSSIFWCC